MHSSRMRTVSCSGRLMGGGCLPSGVSAWGCLSGGCLPRRGRGVCPGGVCLEVSAGGEGVHPLLWTEFLTHTCENITFPQLRLRTIKNTNIGFPIRFSSISSHVNSNCFVALNRFHVLSVSHGVTIYKQDYLMNHGRKVDF